MQTFNPVTQDQSEKETNEVLKRMVFVSKVLGRQEKERVAFDYIVHPKVAISIVSAMDLLEKTLPIKEMLKEHGIKNNNTEDFAKMVSGLTMLQFGYELGMLRSEGGVKDDKQK